MIRFGIIGTGKITDKFLKAASLSEKFRLTAVYSRTEQKAREYAEEYHAKLWFDSLEEMAACEEVDAVYVASPNCCHAEQTILLLKAGKHVLCEKPIASNYKEFVEMRKAAEENQVVLMEAMRSVHAPGFAVVRENLSKLGKIRQVSFQFCQYSSRYDNFKKGIVENAFRPELSNGALMDLGVYCVYPMAALFGMPEKITGSALKLKDSIDGAGVIIADYEGMQAVLQYSKISDSCTHSQIQGEKGAMLIDHIADLQAVEIRYRDGRSEQFDIPKVESNMCYEVAEFIRLVENNIIAPLYMEDSEKTMRILDEARRQMGIDFPADIK